MIRVAARYHHTGDYILSGDALRPLFIVSCGYQYFLSKDFSIRRPEGRPDYQLLYMYKGCGHFLLDGNWRTVGEGSLILYKPTDPQVYTYRAADHPEIYWIHFLGLESVSLLETYEIRDAFIGRHRTLKQIFEEIILELQLHKPMFHEIAMADFHKMLALINRFMQLQYKPRINSPLIDQLIAELGKRYMEEWDIRAMADYCHLSMDHFSHQFKKAAGLSPIQFLTQLRIEQAKELLLTESLSVSEVSQLVGYQDALYFSRVFKKATGTSPRMFHGNRGKFDEHVSTQ